MIRRLLKLAAITCFFFALTGVARADILPGGFNFTFFNDALTGIFLRPFRLSGCPLF